MTEEINLEELIKKDSPEFRYIKTFLEEAILESSLELVKKAINNLKDIGDHISGKPRIIGGYEKYKKLYLRLQNQDGSIQEAYVSDVPEKYQEESSHSFALNGIPNEATIKLKYV